MFGLGTGEIMVILVLALLLLGPAKLPEAAKSIGKGLRSITRATEDVKRQVHTAMYEEERKLQSTGRATEVPNPFANARPESVPATAPEAAPAVVPPGGVPSPQAAAAPATAANVPGLDAALAEPAPTPAAPRTDSAEAARKA